MCTRSVEIAASRHGRGLVTLANHSKKSYCTVIGSFNAIWLIVSITCCSQCRNKINNLLFLLNLMPCFPIGTYSAWYYYLI